MKRLLFATLMVVCSVSWADWVYENNTDSFIIFLDKSTIRKNGNIAKMWELKDFFVAQTDNDWKKFKSSKVRRAYNCREEKIAVIAVIDYSGSMGVGDVIASVDLKESNWNWFSIVPDSLGEDQWKIVCGKQ